MSLSTTVRSTYAYLLWLMCSFGSRLSSSTTAKVCACASFSSDKIVRHSFLNVVVGVVMVVQCTRRECLKPLYATVCSSSSTAFSSGGTDNHASKRVSSSLFFSSLCPQGSPQNFFLCLPDSFLSHHIYRLELFCAVAVFCVKNKIKA